MTTDPKWWGDITLPVGNSMKLDIGLLSLVLDHNNNEWSIYARQVREREQLNNPLNHQIDKTFAPHPLLIDDEFASQTETRYVVGNSLDIVNIRPVLADRSVVCRPLRPISVLPDTKVILYVTTPIWLAISLVADKTTLLQEVASQRLSDTWFGPSTMEGDLCYASVTNGRTDLTTLPSVAHRVTTPLIIHNQADSILSFERVAIPIPLLSLFTVSDGQFWTEAVTFIRDDSDENDLAKLKIGKQQPHTTLVSGPRRKSEIGQFIRAFSAIFK